MTHHQDDDADEDQLMAEVAKVIGDAWYLEQLGVVLDAEAAARLRTHAAQLRRQVHDLRTSAAAVQRRRETNGKQLGAQTQELIAWILEEMQLLETALEGPEQ